MTAPKSKLRKAVEVLVWIAALAVLAENIALFRQNQRLLEAAAPQIAAGTHLRMLSGLALEGRVEPVSLPPGSSKLLIITFLPGCPACQANQEGWTKLANTLEQKGVRVLWVSRDLVEVTREYCLKHGIPLIDAVADRPYRTYRQLGLGRVPNTVLVGLGGTVEKVWAGRLDQDGWNSVFAYFGEGQGMASQAGSTVGAITPSCGPELSGASPKNCKSEPNLGKERRKEMLRLIPKVVLLMALLTTLVVSSVPAFASKTCQCITTGCFYKKTCSPGGCQFDNKTSQCVNISCSGICF